MEYHIALPQGLNYYFTLLMFFLGGYWIAYIFKNLSNLLERLGIIAYVFLMVLFFSVFAILLPTVEGMEDYWITGGYTAGFFLRFFRHDH